MEKHLELCQKFISNLDDSISKKFNSLQLFVQLGKSGGTTKRVQENQKRQFVTIAGRKGDKEGITSVEEDL